MRPRASLLPRSLPESWLEAGVLSRRMMLSYPLLVPEHCTTCTVFMTPLKLLESLLPCPLLDLRIVGLACVTVAYGDGSTPESTVSALWIADFESIALHGVVGVDTLLQSGLLVALVGSPPSRAVVAPTGDSLLPCGGFLASLAGSQCLPLLHGALVMTAAGVADAVVVRPFLALARLLVGLQQLVSVPQALFVGLAAALDGDM